MSILYEGFFVIDHLDSKLYKDIEHKHITTEFKPAKTHEHLYGKEATLIIIGYGNDSINEGYCVKMISCEDDELQELYNNISIPHITLSVSEEGKPVNTSKLAFEQTIERVIKCRFGGFTNKPIFENLFICN